MGNLICVLDLVANYGADPTGQLSVSSKLDAAWAELNASPVWNSTLWIPPGRYKIDQNWVASLTGATPKQAHIMFSKGARLEPTAAVTVAVTLAGEANSDGETNALALSGLRLDGVATTGATGLLVGQNVGNLSGRIHVEDTQIFRFLRTGGKGLEVRDNVDNTYDRVTASRCQTGLYMNATNPALSTLQVFRSCRFRENTDYGADIRECYGARFYDCLFEANYKEGVYIAPLSGEIVTLVDFINCWYEGNWQGDAAQATKYHMTVNGTGAAGASVNVSIHGGSFIATNKSYHFTKNNAFVVDGPAHALSQALVDVDCSGSFVNYAPSGNGAYDANVTNNAWRTTAVARGPTDWTSGLFEGNRGDASITLVAGTDLPVQWAGTALTANRTWTFSMTGVYPGAKFRIYRTGLGAFTLTLWDVNLGALKVMPASTAAWADVAYNNNVGNWRLVGYGVL